VPTDEWRRATRKNILIWALIGFAIPVVLLLLLHPWLRESGSFTVRRELPTKAITAVGMGLDAYVAVDASGTFSETKRQVGLLRMLQAGVIVSDYATLMVEILKDNARPEAGSVYAAMDMPWAKLVGQIARAYGK